MNKTALFYFVLKERETKDNVYLQTTGEFPDNPAMVWGYQILDVNGIGVVYAKKCCEDGNVPSAKWADFGGFAKKAIINGSPGFLPSVTLFERYWTPALRDNIPLMDRFLVLNGVDAERTGWHGTPWCFEDTAFRAFLFGMESGKADTENKLNVFGDYRLAVAHRKG